jgi:hypothetical protein
VIHTRGATSGDFKEATESACCSSKGGVAVSYQPRERTERRSPVWGGSEFTTIKAAPPRGDKDQNFLLGRT